MGGELTAVQKSSDGSSLRRAFRPDGLAAPVASVVGGAAVFALATLLEAA